MLHLSMYKAQEELQRTREELGYIPIDAIVLLACYQHQQQILSMFALKMHATSSLTHGLAHCILVRLHEVKMLMSHAHALFSKKGILPM